MTNMKIKIKQRIDVVVVDDGNVQTVQAKIKIVPFFFFQIVRQAQFNYVSRDGRDSVTRDTEERKSKRASDRTTMKIKHETKHISEPLKCVCLPLVFFLRTPYSENSSVFSRFCFVFF